MNSDRLFDRFPEFVLEDFRRKLLLGLVDAGTVRTVLGPLLQDYREVMERLAPELRRDFDNILRLYPDVAAGFGLRVKPALESALAGLAGALRRGLHAMRQEFESDLDIAAEVQQPLSSRETEWYFSGQGFFQCAGDDVVFFEFSFFPAEGAIVFERQPPAFPLEVSFCGRPALDFRPGETLRKMSAGDFLDALKNDEPLPGFVTFSTGHA